jgi:CHRD domain
MEENRMKTKVTIAACAALVLIATGIGFTDSQKLKEILLGVKEVPVVSTTGSGTFEAEISRDETEIAYTLSFAALEGDVRQAHIHIAPEQNTGPIVLWLCQSALNPAPAGTNPPQCSDATNPATLRANTVSGVLTAADVIVQTANGIDAKTPEEFAEIVALIRAGKAYANVHTGKSPAGEIRSQLDHSGHSN